METLATIKCTTRTYNSDQCEYSFTTACFNFDPSKDIDENILANISSLMERDRRPYVFTLCVPGEKDRVFYDPSSDFAAIFYDSVRKMFIVSQISPIKNFDRLIADCFFEAYNNYLVADSLLVDFYFSDTRKVERNGAKEWFCRIPIKLRDIVFGNINSEHKSVDGLISIYDSVCKMDSSKDIGVHPIHTFYPIHSADECAQLLNNVIMANHQIEIWEKSKPKK